MNEPILPRAGSIAWDITEQSDGEQPEDLAHDLSDGESPHEGKVQEKSASDPVSVATETLRRCTWGASTPDGRTVAATLRARVARRANGEERPVVTPWTNLNTAMGGGFWPGLHVIVGSTGTGKSQFAMQLAVTGGVPGLYFALELDALGLYTRAAALLCHGRMADENGRPLAVAWSDFYTGRVQVPELVDEELAAIPLHWMEAPPHGFGYDGIAPHIAALRALHPAHTGPVVIVVDFLQLVAGTNPREDLRERIGRASYACRAAARDHDAVVLALSSTSREGSKLARVDGSRADGPNDDGEGRRGQFRGADDESDPKRPPLFELVGLGKESGDVEYSADSVLTFCPETWPDGEKPPKGGKRIHVAVAKLRAGPASWCALAFDGTRFTEPPAPPSREPDEIIPGNGNGKGRRSKYGRGRGPSGTTNTNGEPDPFTGEPLK
jgi:replicative DNA helicase